ncbi:MAG TPA: endonuclease/exonuclease/phosphatase family protein [Longimicrobiales bacterium]|nr:endonuclease/exonuclease/phosphatase family protein [Longimicrobiales bacterium]
MNRNVAVLLLVLPLAACNDTLTTPTFDADATVTPGRGPVVMTRNMYLGADLDPILEAGSPQQVPFIAANVWATIQGTDPEARAGAMADEIIRANPDLVGLQEAVSYHIQSPGDAAFGGTTPATTVAYDFVQLLLDSLSARGATYNVVSMVTNTVVELPVYTGAAPVPFDDVRFTDRDAIIARAGVAVSNPQGAVFAARINMSIGGAGGPPLSQLRGWTSIDATIGGRAFRFVNAHLEVQPVAPIQVAQAQELLAITAASPLPVVMVGDFNSAADGSQTPTYGMVVAAGFSDVWQNSSPGYTCCHAEDLSNELPAMSQRIDFIFLRGFGSSPSIGGTPQIVGNLASDRVRAGLWPSDHAGVVAALRL